MNKNSNNINLKRITVVAIFIIGTALVCIAVIAILMSKNQTKTINSFQDCADAGYPIQETYPERCAVPGGKTFTND